MVLLPAGGRATRRPLRPDPVGPGGGRPGPVCPGGTRRGSLRAWGLWQQGDRKLVYPWHSSRPMCLRSPDSRQSQSPCVGPLPLFPFPVCPGSLRHFSPSWPIRGGCFLMVNMEQHWSTLTLTMSTHSPDLYRSTILTLDMMTRGRFPGHFTMRAKVCLWRLQIKGPPSVLFTK